MRKSELIREVKNLKKRLEEYEENRKLDDVCIKALMDKAKLEVSYVAMKHKEYVYAGFVPIPKLVTRYHPRVTNKEDDNG